MADPDRTARRAAALHVLREPAWDEHWRAWVETGKPHKDAFSAGAPVVKLAAMVAEQREGAAREALRTFADELDADAKVAGQLSQADHDIMRGIASRARTDAHRMQRARAGRTGR